MNFKGYLYIMSVFGHKFMEYSEADQNTLGSASLSWLHTGRFFPPKKSSFVLKVDKLQKSVFDQK